MLDREIITRDNPPEKLGRLVASCEFIVETERQLVVVKFRSRVTVEEVGKYAERLSNHPSFLPTFSEITDLRDATEIDLQAEDFLRLADRIDPFAPEAKRAFVVSTAVQNHAARMHKILRAERNIEIFHSFEEAERWVES